MGSPHKEKERFEVVLDRKSQSREDLAINGKQEQYSYKSDGWKHPFILYVDGVVSKRSHRWISLITYPSDFSLMKEISATSFARHIS